MIEVATLADAADRVAKVLAAGWTSSISNGRSAVATLRRRGKNPDMNNDSRPLESD